MNFNGSPAALKIRTEQPVVFLKEFALSPLIYLRLVGIVSLVILIIIIAFINIFCSFSPSSSLAACQIKGF